MDPNENLRQQRLWARKIEEEIESDGPNSTSNVIEASVQLAALVQALDQWIVNGGFLPSEWTR